MKIEDSQAPVEYHYELRLVRIDPPSDSAGSLTIQVNLPVGARIVSARNEGPALRAVPMLVALVDPRVTETQPRRFVLLTRNKAVASSLPLEPVAVFTSPDGQQILAVLEEPTGATA